MDARDQLRDKLDQQSREAEQEGRWGQIFTKLVLIWASVFISVYLLLPGETAIGALVTMFAGGLGAVAGLASFLSRSR